MRKEFVQCKTEDEAEKECPWAAKIVQVEGGFMCFESLDDFCIWRNQ